MLIVATSKERPHSTSRSKPERTKPDLWTFLTDNYLSNMSGKRKTDVADASGPDQKKARSGIKVLPQRVRTLKAGILGEGPIIYWCA